MLGDLSFIKGKWAGSGWMMTQNGKKEAFIQTEDISYQLDGTLLLILGHGKAGGETIHNALALVSYNKEKQQQRHRKPPLQHQPPCPKALSS